jgi:gluconokinase
VAIIQTGFPESHLYVIIGVDIGTSGTKAIAYTGEGAVIANTYVSYNPIATPPGYHELDVDVLFNAVVTCIQGTAQQVIAATGKIAGISFSAAMHSLIAVDASGARLPML